MKINAYPLGFSRDLHGFTRIQWDHVILGVGYNRDIAEYIGILRNTM